MFENLEQFGIKESKDIDIFKEDEKVQKVKENVEKAKEDNALFLKKMNCPVCKKEGSSPAIKARYLRVLSKDTDLMPIYQGINGLFYGITLCPDCGYANLSSEFKKINSFQKELIKEKVCSVWTKKKYEDYLSLDDAIDLHKLALYNAIVKKSLYNEKAIICLRLSWLYRLKEDKEQELKFQKEALRGFELAYSKDSKMIGLSTVQVLFLLGELNRRVGNDTDALRYFSEVLVNPSATYVMKEDVRDIRDLMKEKSQIDAKAQ